MGEYIIKKVVTRDWSHFTFSMTYRNEQFGRDNNMDSFMMGLRLMKKQFLSNLDEFKEKMIEAGYKYMEIYMDHAGNAPRIVPELNITEDGDMVVSIRGDLQDYIDADAIKSVCDAMEMEYSDESNFERVRAE